MEASFYPQVLTVFLGLLIWPSQRQAHSQDSSSQGSSDEWVAQFWNLYNMSCCVEQDQVAQNIIDQEVTGILQFVQASESWSTIAPKSQMKRNKENQHLEYLHPCITFSVIPSCNYWNSRDYCFLTPSVFLSWRLFAFNMSTSWLACVFSIVNL